MERVFKYTIVIILISIEENLSLKFDQKYFGVTFEPYVMYRINGINPQFTQYSLNDVEMMLKLVSEKVSRVSTYGNDVFNVPYEVNSTYYNSQSGVYTAEASARINRETNKTSLEVIVGVWIDPNPQMMINSMLLALESAAIANKIYPGTVKALVMFENHLVSDKSKADKALNLIKTYKIRMDYLGLKVGVRLREADMFISAGDTYSKVKNLLDACDFVICENTPNAYYYPEFSFSKLRDGFITIRNEIQKHNQNIEVMGQTQWATAGPVTWENADKLRRLWELANNFAVVHNYTMWLVEAFDNPWKSWSLEAPNHGWWKLSKHSEVLLNLKDAYIEKISEFPTPNGVFTTTSSTSKPTEQRFENENSLPSRTTWIFAGIGIGVGIILIVFIAVIMWLCVRVKWLTSVLSNADVQEFMTGFSEKKVEQPGGRESLLNYALKFPYDRSYEIEKGKLTIKYNEILGKGQFGCVQRANIEGPQGDIEVALKMAKSDNCGKQVLKGLLSEIKIMIYLGKHPNVVSIVGAYTAELMNGVVYVATELCGLGSLEKYLRGHLIYIKSTPTYKLEPSMNPNNTEFDSVTYHDMVRWSFQISNGMEFLESKHVVHADLAARNILLSSDKIAKITDFGLSRRMYDYANYVKKQQEPLPWRWMSIESLKRLEFSSQSDVWSYGVLLWEIFSMGEVPFPGYSWNLDFVEKLVGGMRMKCPRFAAPEIYKLMESCWNIDPTLRPSFGILKNLIAHILEVEDKNYTFLNNETFC